MVLDVMGVLLLYRQKPDTSPRNSEAASRENDQEP